MLIKDLKKDIENKSVNNDMIIFQIKDNNFIAKQYIREIARLLNKEIENIDELPRTNINNIWGDLDLSDNLKVYETDCLEKVDLQKNLFIITNKISDEIKEKFSGYIVEVPKLEEWQIRDYALSLAEGVNEDYLGQLCEVCHYDIYRLDNEIKKLSIFEEKERPIMFKNMLDDNMYSDLSKHNIFDLSSAILKKDTKTISKLYKHIDNMDCEPLGLLTILYNNFKNVINIQLSNNPTPESCGLKSNQFWAIKKNNCGYYTGKQLIKILSMLTSIDKMIKTGKIFTDERLTDYIICYIMSV